MLLQLFRKKPVNDLTPNPETQIGEITYLNKEKQFGFITNENRESFYFSLRVFSTLRKKDRPKFSLGDEVSFEPAVSEVFKNKQQANNVRYICNAGHEKLMQHSQEGKIMEGTLIKVNDEFVVKNLKNKFEIPVEISQWEIDKELIYDNRINQTVTFVLKPAKNFKNIKALLTNRKFSADYHELNQLHEAGTVLPAEIVKISFRGYFVRIFGKKMYGFIRAPKGISEEENVQFFKFNEGDKVSVTLKKINIGKCLACQLV